VRARGAIAVVLLAIAVAACNSPDYDRNTVERDLEQDVGLSAAQARCVAQQLENLLGVRRLGARDDPRDGERNRLNAALLFGVVACSGEPYDRDEVVATIERLTAMEADDAACVVRGVEERVPPERLASGGNLAEERALDVRAAIADATIDCYVEADRTGDELVQALRANAGLSAEEARCLLGEDVSKNEVSGEDVVSRRAAFEDCTSA
jgi:hypothetical protein